MTYIYTFEDGTVLKLLNVGLSVAEIWKLEELHGKCRSIGSEKTDADNN